MILVIKAEVDWHDGRPQEALNDTFSSFVLTMPDYLSYKSRFTSLVLCFLFLYFLSVVDEFGCQY